MVQAEQQVCARVLCVRYVCAIVPYQGSKHKQQDDGVLRCLPTENKEVLGRDFSMLVESILRTA